MSYNMEHVRHLQRMANESWHGSPELAALVAAIVSLSAPKHTLTAEELAEMLGGIIYKNGLGEYCIGIQPDVNVTREVESAVAAINARMTSEPEGHTHPHEESSGCHCVQCCPLERPCGCNGCRSLAGQPASDEGFTAGDMMIARQEGRREARRRAAMFGPAATLAERVAGVATLLDGHGPMAESAAATLRNALASYDVAIAGRQGGES